jgi:hypothetical protein
MAIALKTTAVHRHLRRKELIIQTTQSGSYATGGDTMDFTALTANLGLSDALIGFPGNITDYRVVACPFGYKAEIVKGTALTNWKLKIEYTGAAVSSAYAELAAGAYPAGLATVNVFVLSISGPKGQI